MGIADWQSASRRVALDRREQQRVLGSAEASRVEDSSFISIAGPGRISGKGPLAGVPFAVKDNIDTADLPTSGGTAALGGWRPREDAPAVTTLRRAGAWLVGKTNLHELAFGVTSNNGAYGAVRSPADPARSAGGSSGGSAAAVAAGVVPFALGTDTGGSCTIPAAACGVVGYRPSGGRYSSHGVIHLSRTRDVVGVLATSVADLLLLDGILREPTAPAGPATRGALRLAVPAEYLADLDPGIEAAFQGALERMAAGGIQMVRVGMSGYLAEAREHGFPLVGFEAPRELAAYLSSGAGAAMGIDLPRLAASAKSPDVKVILTGLLAEPVPAATYQRAVVERLLLREQLADDLLSRDVAALVYPTLPTRPPLLGDDFVVLPSGQAGVFETLTRHTETGAFLGNASISIPVAPTGEPPTGLTLEAPFGHDERLLAVADVVARMLHPRAPEEARR